MVSLRLSATVSFQQIEESDPESLDLLFLLGLLPKGVNATDLDYLWSKVTKQSRKMYIEESNNNKSAVGGNEPSFVGSARSKVFGNNLQKQA